MKNRESRGQLVGLVCKRFSAAKSITSACKCKINVPDYFCLKVSLLKGTMCSLWALRNWPSRLNNTEGVILLQCKWFTGLISTRCASDDSWWQECLHRHCRPPALLLTVCRRWTKARRTVRDVVNSGGTPSRSSVLFFTYNITYTGQPAAARSGTYRMLAGI